MFASEERSETRAITNGASSQHQQNADLAETGRRIGDTVDNVFANHSEIALNVPDGGYGWIVLIATIYIKAIIPSVVVAYGLFLLFLTIESAASIDTLWSNNFVLTPVLFIAMQALSEPLCYLIIKNSKWPRFVFLSGVCLTSASILMLWVSIVEGFASNAMPILSGSLSGFGTSLILLQVNIIIKQYFKLKLSHVQRILRAIECGGFMATCLLVGKYVNANGLAHTIIWYHLFVLIGGLAALAVRKPSYLKGRSVYDIGRAGQLHNSDDEEDIFSKTTELQSPQSSVSPTEQSSSRDDNKMAPPQRQQWERFSDDEEENADAQGHLPAPRELFAEGRINNNVTYSFDNSEIVHFGRTDHIFMPNANEASPFLFLTSPRFYIICFLHIALRASTFAFFLLYPSYIYYTMPYLHKATVPYVISIIVFPLLPEALFIDWLQISVSNRRFYIALFAWLGSGGYFLIGSFHVNVALITGGILVNTSLYALEYIARPLVLNNGKTKLQYACLKLIVGISILMMIFSCSLSYQNCFRLMGFVQFVVGSLWLCSCTTK